MDEKRILNGRRVGVITMMLGEMRGDGQHKKNSNLKRWYKRQASKIERRLARVLVRSW